MDLDEPSPPHTRLLAGMKIYFSHSCSSVGPKDKLTSFVLSHFAYQDLRQRWTGLSLTKYCPVVDPWGVYIQRRIRRYQEELVSVKSAETTGTKAESPMSLFLFRAYQPSSALLRSVQIVVGMTFKGGDEIDNVIIVFFCG